MAHSPLYGPSNRPSHQAPRQAGYHVRPRPRSPQRFAWLLSSVALSALAIAPGDLWSRFSTSLSPQPTQQESIQPWSFNRAETAQTCQSMVNANQRLSRGQLTQFLSIAQDSSQASIHETIAPPYCTLSKEHQSKQSEAYPLAFDPDTWFVVNYDQGIYKSYDFVFRQ